MKNIKQAPLSKVIASNCSACPTPEETAHHIDNGMQGEGTASFEKRVEQMRHNISCRFLVIFFILFYLTQREKARRRRCWARRYVVFFIFLGGLFISQNTFIVEDFKLQHSVAKEIKNQPLSYKNKNFSPTGFKRGPCQPWHRPTSAIDSICRSVSNAADKYVRSSSNDSRLRCLASGIG